MEKGKIKSIIEAILFAVGREVKIDEIVLSLEINKEEIAEIIQEMQKEYQKQNRGIEIIKVDDGYQMCSKKELHEYIYSILDKRNKPSLSQAALETLAIIAYNPKITRAEIEAIRGVNADAGVYKLLEYNLIESAGKADLPGRPTMYKTTGQFLKMFGYETLEDLPELPKYKIDENEQIVIDELVSEEKINSQNLESTEEINKEYMENEDIEEVAATTIEAPLPERDIKEDLINQEEK